jgi:hypothetical protein
MIKTNIFKNFYFRGKIINGSTIFHNSNLGIYKNVHFYNTFAIMKNKNKLEQEKRTKLNYNWFFCILKKKYKDFFLRPYINFSIFASIILLNICIPYSIYCNSLLAIYFVYLVKKFFALMCRYASNYKNISEKDVWRDIYNIIIPLFIISYLCILILEFLHPIFGQIIVIPMYFFFGWFCADVYAMGPESSDTVSSNNVGSNSPSSNKGGSINKSSSNLPPPAYRPKAIRGLPHFAHNDIMYTTRASRSTIEQVLDDFS